jgi:hypothetical protein
MIKIFDELSVNKIITVNDNHIKSLTTEIIKINFKIPFNLIINTMIHKMIYK